MNPEAVAVAEAVSSVLNTHRASIRVDRLPVHASARTYYRARSGGGRSVVVMVLPADPRSGDEVGSGSRDGKLTFLKVQRYLFDLGVRVPAVLRLDLEAGLLVMEDLGDTTLEQELLTRPGCSNTRRRLYGKAVDQLALMRCQSARRPDLAAENLSGPFDYKLLRWELDHFLEWGLCSHYGVSLTGEETGIVTEAFDDIAGRLSALSRGLTHRDYQSRNLMVVPDGLAVIDFQDALLGPAVYDLVALLRDSYVILDRSLVDEMLDRYCDACRALGGRPVDRETLEDEFDLQTVQRKLKDAGRFVFIDREKNNPDFMPYMEPSLRYVASALERLPEYRRLWKVLSAHVPELRAVS